jgi:DNA polymerase-3 subunit delta
MTNSVQIRLLSGSDDVVLANAVSTAVSEALGDDDPTLALTVLTEEDYRSGDDYDTGALVDAALTPPLLSDKRVVVGRELGRFKRAEQLGPLVDAIADLLPSTLLVLVWEKGPALDRLEKLPKALKVAVEAAGGTAATVGIPGGRGASQWLTEQLESAPVSLDKAAQAALADRLGNDLNRVWSVLDSLAGAYGPGAKVTAEQLIPYVGEAGGVPPWELTDAIDSGDIAAALDRLHRGLQAGEMHPLQVLSSLHRHHERMLVLDGANAADEKAAANMLGMKGSTYPAKKALTQTRKLGSSKIGTAIALLARADLDLRGESGLPDEVVLEVLVARLARLNRR